eukprot:CAMPEP_0116008202 /NCGR_PEP_ID=MMETSP0321-20121206/2731_1 /TAXON_ID=163516 /ORGANISM="Leptocylindrus danicus var. danicus, Strain B650" /LENGTH=266 /DNA_ID=CAMNT_0003476997 /DNA_START=145 /DNA_END=945 /DNA_ORIENTATION=+
MGANVNKNMIPRKDREFLLQTEEKVEDCVVQLIMLGADVNRKLHLYPRSRCVSRTSSFSVMSKWYKLNLNGKTVKQMVQMSNSHRAIDAIEAMKSNELKIANAHCRCGSRLRWKECHSGGLGEEKHYDNADVLLFRCSPLARCECELTCKAHYDCCWKYGRRSYYMNDETGIATIISTSGMLPASTVQRLGLNTDTPGIPSSFPTPPDELMNDFDKGKCPQAILDYVQRDWKIFCDNVPPEMRGGKSGMENMDPDRRICRVYFSDP